MVTVPRALSSPERTPARASGRRPVPEVAALAAAAVLATWASGLLWGFGLALLRGWSGGIVAPLTSDDESLVDVPRVDDVLEALRVYTDRILLTAPDHWTTYESGHPPLPLLFYVLLDRVGLGGPGAGGVVAALIGSTGVVAVLVTLRALGDERRARAAAPFLAVTPLVVWTVVSTDAVIMALAARTWRPLVPAALAALAVAAAFAAAGFWWLEGYSTLVVRYYEGKGGVRQYSYWIWANLAVAAFAVGPALVAALGRTAALVGRWRSAAPTALLAGGARRWPSSARRCPGCRSPRSSGSGCRSCSGWSR